MNLRFLLRVAACVAAFALAAGQTPNAAVPNSPLDPSDIDHTCKACDDFYQFAVGGWLKKNPILPEFGSSSPWIGRYEANEALLHDALEKAAADPNATGETKQVGTFYRVCMDEARANRLGAQPLADEMARIDGATDLRGFQTELARVSRATGDIPTSDVPHWPLMAYLPTANPGDSTQQIGGLLQSGTTLPSPEYYTAAQFAPQRGALTTFAASLFTLIGEPADKAAADAATALDVEAALSKISMKREDLFNPQNTSTPANLKSLAQLQALAPAIDWRAYITDLHAPTDVTIDVATLDYFKQLSGMLTTRPLSDWKTYLKWWDASHETGALSTPFVDAGFQFQKDLVGVQQQRPRWKRCLAQTSAQLSEAVGQVFVARAFSGAAKARAVAMVGNIRTALRDDLTTLPWMSTATRTEALRKLGAMKEKIAYPDRWRDYTGLAAGDVSYAANLDAARAFNIDFFQRQAGKPTNRDQWAMSPQTINAQYDPQNNDITFPAAILLSPFFSASGDDATNYGAIGAVIGHEMTHGFDNTGRQYNAGGNLKDWWTPADSKSFDARAACIIQEYDGLPVAQGVMQNGKLVQGEAIADFGGLTLAYRAFKKTAQYKANRPIDGYTPDQRFFLAYAKVWAENATEKSLIAQAKGNEHSIGKNRVLGTLMNMPEFAKAFHCAAGAKMVAKTRCQIW